jgi:type IV secretory pathway VirB6-like protein
MPEDLPQSAKNAAILQIISGVINFFVMPMVVWFGVSIFASMCAFCTAGLGGITYMCGFVSCLLPPIGIAEMIVGAIALTNPKQGIPFGRIVSMVEMGSILAGGLISAIIGFVTMRMYGADEVTEYLEQSS